MARVIFYEKPGCINNAKQKALLWSAGHEVLAHNLLKTPWTFASLRPFFGDLKIVDWFNKTAPLVKSGEVVPKNLDEKTALDLMMKYPLLIRRPLIQVEDVRQVGFNYDQIDAWIGLSAPKVLEDLENCPRTH
ncbi:nitrogenase-associated protein [Xenococcus sp. PCC 7305]|uniref:ArsC/Spx/MgsR family protein n=1 Tax=Xenococcus sp. PCC 7305 TaxID=102125 RepID=UPI0002ABDF67|nr:ArsC/Spx/MgsR family protein [Xenococcus sp. PCC 7305]ELS05186.1 nitrogenase-associated protein [Xenococcus sp. PCC 7305]